LDEIVYIAKSLHQYDQFFITYESARTRSLGKAYLMRNLLQSPFAFLLSFLQMLVILARERPAAIISTGAEIALPAFIIGKVLRCRLIYVESLCRARFPSATGRILYFISDLFLVQWPDLAAAYGRRARYVGGLL